ncbi:MAG: 50S ribosomal protein L32 [Weeksellaceae bacterium]
MAPLPKRKHSKARKGKRLNQRELDSVLPNLIVCKECGKKKLPHRQCKYCGK